MESDTLNTVTQAGEQTEISQLRTEAYRLAYGTQLKSYDFLQWDANDARALVMYLRNAEGRMVASLRALLRLTQNAMEELFDIKSPAPIPVPTMALDRLVVLPSQRGKGLTHLFRYYLYAASIGSVLKSFTFTINEGSSRIPLQQKLGFQFATADTSHRLASPYHNEAGVLLAHLSATDFAQACEITRERLLVNLTAVRRGDRFDSDVQRYLAQIAEVQSSTD
ncbi:MAG: hypothetical protein AAGN35_18760 [Bacteroidota bacterium]